MNGQYKYGTFGGIGPRNYNDVGLSGGTGNLFDLAVGDTTTSLSAAFPSNYYLTIQIDLGASPTYGIASARANFLNFAGNGVLYYSDDGFAWTSTIASLPNNALTSTGNLSPHRFWQLQLPYVGTGTTASVSDVRLFDTNSQYVVGYDGTAPDFSLTPSSQNLSIQAGGASGTLSPDLTVNAIGGFSSAVTLAVTGQPTGMTATLSSTSVSPGGTSNLTVSATSAVAPGVYTLTITGTGGGSTHTQSVNVTVTASADFSITPSSQNLTIASGGSSGSITPDLTINAIGGFSGAVSLAVTGQPAGITATLSSTSVSPGGTSNLTVSATSAVVAGNYTLTITGTNGSLSHTQNVTITVTADFSLTPSTQSTTVQAGGSSSTITSDVTVTAIGGFTATVSLAVTGQPTGMTATLANPNRTAGQSSDLTINAGSGVAPGTYNLTVTGTSGSLTHTQVVSVTVTAASDFSITPSSQSFSVISGGASQAKTPDLTVNAVSGFSGTTTLAISGLTAGITATLSSTSVVAGGTSNLTVSAGSGVSPGTYTFTITGTSGSLTHTQSVSVTVTAPVLPPAAPTGVTTVPGNSQVTVSWTNAAGTTSSNVKRSTVSTGPYTNLVAGTSVTGTTFVDLTAVNGTAYYYEVSNLNSGGEGAVSAFSGPVTPNGPPNAPVSLTATPGANFITLNWSAPSGGPSVIAYFIYKLIGSTYTRIGSVGSGTFTFTDYAVPNNFAESYYVSANGAGGEGAASNIATATIIVTGGGSYMENPTYLRGVQLGLETTPGTSVPATVRATNANTVPTKHETTRVVKGQGTKGSIGAQRQKSWSEGRMTGAIDYLFMAYLAAGVIKSGVTPVTVGVTSKKWTWVMDMETPDTPQTYTMEYGNTAGSNKQIPFLVFSDLTFKVNETTADFEASYFGQTAVEPFTVTAGLADLATPLANPLDFRVNLATTFAGLSNTTAKLTKLEDFEMHLHSHYKSVFFVDDANPSYGGILERQPSVGAKITSEQGSDTANMLSQLRNKQLVYLQLQGTGLLLETGTPNVYYSLKATMPAYVTNTTDSDYQEVYSGVFDFEGASDPVNGGFIIELITTIAAL